MCHTSNGRPRVSHDCFARVPGPRLGASSRHTSARQRLTAFYCNAGRCRYRPETEGPLGARNPRPKTDPEWEATRCEAYCVTLCVFLFLARFCPRISGTEILGNLRGVIMALMKAPIRRQCPLGKQEFVYDPNSAANRNPAKRRPRGARKASLRKHDLHCKGKSMEKQVR